ncbi:hypothetical protein [Paenibacillus gansuensis]|uniref:HEAT repeat domain-containing protein n=1 Tax=Paenibacillus gansuensis TaxID=306542 RepID=A0ABW5PD63_9BACL
MTRMLETEQYGEAIDLLEFLLQCQGEDERTYEEWGSLLNWLVTAFPHAKAKEDSLEEDLTETDLLKEHIRNRTLQDPGYASRILDTLRSSQEIDKKLLALGQLSYIEHPEIDRELIRFIESEPAHPLLQSKAIQTLKARGAEGEVTIRKNGETCVIDIESYPMSPDDFPQDIREVLIRVQEVSEVHSPALAYFAEETWNDFVFYMYGSTLYNNLLKEPGDSTIDLWAAALHATLLETMSGEWSPEELFELYGVSDSLLFRFEQAHKALKSYVQGLAL